MKSLKNLINTVALAALLSVGYIGSAMAIDPPLNGLSPDAVQAEPIEVACAGDGCSNPILNGLSPDAGDTIYVQNMEHRIS